MVAIAVDIIGVHQEILRVASGFEGVAGVKATFGGKVRSVVDPGTDGHVTLAIAIVVAVGATFAVELIAQLHALEGDLRCGSAGGWYSWDQQRGVRAE